jgi:hypothetical protein
MTNYKEAVIMPAVKRGAELLDEVLPGWAKAINVRLLNLATPFPVIAYPSANAVEGTGCILCQLDHYLESVRAEDYSLPRQPIRLKDFGTYSDGLQQLQEYMSDGYPDGGNYGFDIMDEFTDEDGDLWDNPYDSSTYYSILDELWKEEIAIRTTNSN